MKVRYLENKRISIALIVLLTLSYSVICLSKNSFSTAMAFIVSEGLLTKTETGVITAVFYLIYAPMQIVGGMLADRWHPERFLVIGYLGAGVANLVIYFNQSYYVMLVTWALNALVQFAIWPATFKVLTTMLAKEHRQSAAFIITLANPAGVMMGYVVASFVGRWQNNFLMSASILLASGVAWLVASFALKKHLREETVLPKKLNVKVSDSFSFMRTMVRSGLPLIICLSFIGTLFNLGVKGLIPTLIMESYEEVSASLATILNIIVLAASTLGLFVARLLYPHVVKTEVKAAAILFTAALVPLAFSMLIGKVSYWLIVVAYALVIMLQSGMGLLTVTYTASRFNKWGKGSTVSGISNCMASLGVVFSNLVFTRTADSLGWDGTIRLWVGVMAIGALLAFITIPIWNRFLKTDYQQ